MEKLNAALMRSAILRTRIRHISRPVPSLFYFPGIESKPIHSHTGNSTNDFPFIQTLIDNHDVIVDEYKKLREYNDSKTGKQSDYELNKGEHELHSGQWDWNSYILKGQVQPDFQLMCPKTTDILNNIPRLLKNIPFSYSFFSTLKGNTKIAPHYGPSNIRLRCHYPLIIPKESIDLGMQVGNESIVWKEKVPVIFDDCYEHHVWNNTKEDRVVLLFDLWHPSLHVEEIYAIEEMFDYSRKQGWIHDKNT